MTNITWKIEALDCKPQEAGFTDVVITAHWRCIGTDENFNASVYATCSFSQPSEPFIPFEQLTEQQVLDWCWSAGVNKEATEDNINQQINNLINPPVITPPLPWSQASE